MKQRTPRLVDKYCLTKTVTILAGVLFMLGFMLAPSGSAQGASVSELEKQKQDLQNQVAQNQKLAQQKQAEANKLSSQIDSLSGDIDKAQNQINQTSGQITQANSDISQTQGQIDDTKKKLDIENKKLNSTIVELYRATNKATYRSTLMLLLSSSDIAAATEGGTQLTVLQEQIDEGITKIETLKAEFEKQKITQQTKKDELEQLKNQQESQRRSVQSQQNYKNSLLGMTVEQQKEYLAIVDKLQGEHSRVSDQIYAERQKQLISGRESLSGGSSGYPYTAIDVPDEWNFLTRECTSYVAWYWNVRLGKRWYNTQPGRGSAKYWPEIARTLGYSVTSTPRVGAIISFNGPLFDGDQWGHVAIVEAVNGNGTLDVSEYNWVEYSYSYRRNVTPSGYGSYSYIY